MQKGREGGSDGGIILHSIFFVLPPAACGLVKRPISEIRPLTSQHHSFSYYIPDLACKKRLFCVNPVD